MNDYWKNLLANNIPAKEPPAGLLELILKRINLKRIYYARLRFGVFSSFALASFVLLAPSIQYLASDFYTSGFYSYISIALTDSSSAIMYWKDFTLALADSFPILAATAVFAALFVLLGSLRSLSRDMRVAFLSNELLLS